MRGVPNVEAFIARNLDGPLHRRAVALGVKSVLEVATASVAAACLVGPAYVAATSYTPLDFQYLEVFSTTSVLALAFFQANVACRFGTRPIEESSDETQTGLDDFEPGEAES